MRQDFYKGMRFWLDKGIDGYRIDVASYCSKDTLFPEIDFTRYKSFGDYYCHGPHVHDYLQEMYREVFGKYDCMTVGEGNPWINTLDFTDARRKEFNMFYVNANDVVPKQMPDGSPLVTSDVKMQALRSFYTSQDSLLHDAGWPTVILGNHDLPRMQSYWGDDSTPELARLSSQALITFLMTMRGTVFFYGGDEIGMNNVRFEHIEDYNDIVTRSYYANILSLAQRALLPLLTIWSSKSERDATMHVPQCNGLLSHRLVSQPAPPHGSRLIPIIRKLM